MPRPKSDETRKLKKRALCLLANGRTQSEVADILSRNIRTIQKWVADPEFKSSLQKLRDEVEASQVEVRAAIVSQSHQENEEVFRTTGRLAVPLVEQVFEVTKEILVCPDSRNVDKLKAAALLGRWFGLESDFNVAVTCLRRYGLVLRPKEMGEGEWEVVKID